MKIPICLQMTVQKCRELTKVAKSIMQKSFGKN